MEGALGEGLKLDLKGLGRLGDEDGFEKLGRLKPPPPPDFFIRLSPLRSAVVLPTVSL
jgi:hypothetical protein